MTVEEARDQFLAENGFTLEAYDAPRSPASMLGVNFSVPNTAKHRWAIRLHDLHHVATGFGTDPAGEGEISAWEWRRGGLRGLGLYVGSLLVIGTAMGLALAPLRTWKAFRAATSGPSLFTDGALDYDALLCLSVGELRATLGLPLRGVASVPRGLHSTAPRR